MPAAFTTLVHFSTSTLTCVVNSAGELAELFGAAALDFDKKQLAGYAELSIETNGKTNELHLDARDLTIDSVWADGEVVTYSLGKSQPYVGSDLAITIKPTTKKVKVK